MSYVYVESEPGLYTVGFYDPQGGWNPDSDHAQREDAAARVALLNGSGTLALIGKLADCVKILRRDYLHPHWPADDLLTEVHAAIAKAEGRAG